MAKSSKAFCWKTRVTFRCGCVEKSDTAHSCGNDPDKCDVWIRKQILDRECEDHRLAGLNADQPTTKSQPDEPSESGRKVTAA